MLVSARVPKSERAPTLRFQPSDERATTAEAMLPVRCISKLPVGAPPRTMKSQLQLSVWTEDAY